MGERAKAPKIDHPHVISVSQIETFRLCNRKWAYLKIDKEEDPGTASSELGGKVHDVAEDYFKYATPIDPKTQEGQILMPALPHLPPPKYPGMKVEEWFFFDIGCAVVRGLKDLEIPTGWKRDFPWVSDHKTTKSFEWAKTPGDLLKDVQAGVYSYDSYLKYQPVAVDLQWTYMKTTGSPRAEPSKVTIDYDSMMFTIEGVEKTALEMWKTKEQHESAETVAPNFQACDAFGGCPFINKCNPTPNQRFKAIMTQTDTENSFMERLRKRKEEKQKKESPPSETGKSKITKTSEEGGVVAINPPEQSEAPSEEDLQKEVEAKKGKKKAARKTTPKKKAADAIPPSWHNLFDALLEDVASRIAEKINDQDNE